MWVFPIWMAARILACQAIDGNIQVTMDGVKADYLAVPVTGAEADRVASENPHPLAFRFVTGFPPRYFVRLDPTAAVKQPPA